MTLATIYLDIETTGLDPKKHDIVEIAWARDDGPIQKFVPEHDLGRADPRALVINGYFKRKLDKARHEKWGHAATTNLFEALQGSTVAGSSPSFDIRFLYEKWQEEPWHHRLFDVSLYAAGIFGWEQSMGLPATIDHMNKLGFKLPKPDHTAAGDVHAVRELHTALRKIATIRRYVDDAVMADEILKANEADKHTAAHLAVSEVWRANKTRARKNRY